MRHRRRGRQLGRNSSHRKAMLRNLASSLFLTERDAELDDNAPKVKGRVVTTLPKAKEVRPLVERCITVARRSLKHQAAAAEFESSADRGTEAWKQWRNSEQWRQWAVARAPVVAARRRALQMLGDKSAVRILFDVVAPRFEDRPGGYTRVVRLPNHRIGDAGVQAILEFVGVRDRVAEKSQKPAFDADVDETPASTPVAATEAPVAAEESDAAGEDESKE